MGNVIQCQEMFSARGHEKEKHYTLLVCHWKYTSGRSHSAPILGRRVDKWPNLGNTQSDDQLLHSDDPANALRRSLGWVTKEETKNVGYYFIDAIMMGKFQIKIQLVPLFNCFVPTTSTIYNILFNYSSTSIFI